MANLLPKEKRFEILNLYRVRLATVSLWLFFALVLGGLIMLIPAFTGVFSGLKDVDTESAILQAEGKDISSENNREIIMTRERLKLLSSEKESSLRASYQLERILVNLTPGISLRAFIVSGKDYVELRGQSRTREDLLRFVGALRGDRFVERVDSPVSNLVIEENAIFVIKVFFAE